MTPDELCKRIEGIVELPKESQYWQIWTLVVDVERDVMSRKQEQTNREEKQ